MSNDDGHWWVGKQYLTDSYLPQIDVGLTKYYNDDGNEDCKQLETLNKR